MSQHKLVDDLHISDGDLELIIPTIELKADAIRYKEEHFANGDMQVHGSGGLAYYDDYEAWLDHIGAIREAQTSTFFTKRLSDNKLIGCVKIHRVLTAEIESGGHIAYGIRPSERGKGYGTKQLGLALRFAEQIGLRQVIVACDKDNVASAGTAMSCGGFLTKEFEEDGVLKQHYIIDLSSRG